MLGIICGLSSEASIAAKINGAEIACSAAVPQSARTLVRGLVKQGATRLMSFGVAGALDPALPVGSLIVGRQVIAKNGSWECDAGWHRELLQKLSFRTAGDVWGSETLVPTAAEKITLHSTTGCAIVDMESQCAAEVAAEAKLPLAVVRVVCDAAEHNVPPLVMSAINPDGSTNYRNVLTGLVKAPWEILDLIKVGHSMWKALGVLGQAAVKLNP